jgi:hypothetical protein
MIFPTRSLMSHKIAFAVFLDFHRAQSISASRLERSARHGDIPKTTYKKLDKIPGFLENLNFTAQTNFYNPLKLEPIATKSGEKRRKRIL